MNEQIRKEIISLINSIQPFDTGCKATMNVIEGMVNQTFSKYNGMFPDYEDLLNQHDSATTEVEELKKFKSAWEKIKITLEMDKEEVSIDYIKEIEEEFCLGGNENE